MAALLLLPGMGGAYTSESFSSTSTTGADTLDCSRCSTLLVQVLSSSGGGTFVLQNAAAIANGFADLGTPISFVSGTVSRFDPSTGPFGIIRIDATSVTGTGTVTIVGYPTVTVN